MIAELYYYFIKTKYGDFKSSDIEKLKTLHDKSISVGVTADSLSDIKKSAIEIGVLGKELEANFRHVDNYILGNKFIIDCFIEDESTLDNRMKRLAGGMYAV